ncbi:MAG: ATP-binding cassette domain-containing protein [Bacilli bacterium]
MIKLENVSKYYHNEGAVTLGLRKINLELRLGEFVAVTGESGSGKSTLLNVISGIDTYEDGEMFIEGEETSYFDDADWEQYRRDSVGFIFQNYNLIDSYTVLQNVEAALLIQGMDKKTRLQKAKAIIDRVGLTSHSRHRASKLSGGEKQRLSIARALAKETKIIVADEPTGNLDSESSKQILKLLKEVADGRLVVIVTHDFENVEQYVTRKIRLFDGEIVEDKLLRETVQKDVPEKTIGKMTSFKKTFLIAFYNLFSQPKKTILLLLVALTTLVFVFFNYGTKLISDNYESSTYSIYNDYPERLIVTRQDKQAMTTTDYDYFASQNEISKIIVSDLIVDANFTINFEVNDSYYYESGYLNLTDSFKDQQVYGRLPQGENEMAIAFNPYSTDEEFLDSLLNNSYDIDISTSKSNLNLRFKLVGIYKTVGETQFILNDVGVDKLYNYLQVSLFGYLLHVKTDIVEFNYPYGFILVDNALLGYRVKVPESFIWSIGETPLEETIATFNDVPVTLILDTDYNNYNTILISPTFFEEIQLEEDYQYTLNLKDSDQANRVINRLYENGYFAFSPNIASQGLDIEALFLVITNLFATIGVLFSIGVIFIISYLVVRSIILSKKKDYTILRIIGLRLDELKKIVVIEILSVFLFALVLLFGLYFTIVYFSELVRNAVAGLFEFTDYLMLISVSLVVMLLIAWRFISMMTKKSLFSNLKVDGE